MQKTVAQFEIQYRQILNKEAEVTDELPQFANDSKQLIAMYKMMMQTRMFDAKAIALQRTGKLGTYPSSLGQEAISVGVGSAMKSSDVLCPYYREYGAQFSRGVTMQEIYLFWGGSELGSRFTGPQEDLPCCIPIASQTLHAVGVATAFKLRQQQRAAVAVVGDGGTSRGDFYEAVNLAGAWNLPAVFVVNNNQWAISVPRDQQTACQTIAQKAIAGGVSCQQVDGNDVLVVREAVEQALAKAYAGEGPHVIEAITYRMCDHTTADDARRYRPDGEVKSHEQEDPIVRMKKFLVQQNIWSEEQDQKQEQELKLLVNQAVEDYLATPVQPAESMIEFLYANVPACYEDQRVELSQAGGLHG